MNIEGKAALITGTKRIGAVVARRLAARGADLGIAYHRSKEEAERCARELAALGRRAVAIQADLSQSSECGRLVDAAAGALGRLDILVNMASVYAQKPYEELTEADWDAAIDVDLKASHLCACAAVPHMRRAGSGRIVNVSDWIAASGRPRYTGFVPYYVAKAGVIGLTQVLALELAPEILVNAIAPGPIIAPPETSDEELQAVERATPLGRWGGPEVIADAVVFLVETEFVTGEVIRVDGGRHVR